MTYMDKIGLISFHNALNHGAALQAYALQEYIDSLGYESEYLNYVNRARREEYDMKSRIVNSLKAHNLRRAVLNFVGIPLMESRRRKFASFYRKYLHVSDAVYSNSEQVAITNDKYKKFVVGSDQVWNYVNNGADTAFFLDFVKDDAKKISYSSSFGLSELPKMYYEMYCDNLKKFQRLATREMTGVELIRKLTGREAHLVLDPVFLIDVKQWKSMIPTSNNSSKYIFFYTSGKTERNHFGNLNPHEDIKESHILTANISLNELIDHKRKMMISLSPEEFLSEIYNAEYVVTDSFHCLAFCIIFEKPFSIYLSGNRGKDERLINLLKIAGLLDRVIDIKTTKKDVNKAIDFSIAKAHLREMLEYSQKYLEKALADEPDIPFVKEIGAKYFCEDARCTGCLACIDSCPQKAIKVEVQNDGFRKPVRISEKCIDCGICHSVCQVNEKCMVDNSHQQFWALKNKKSIRQSSSSGGAFTALSDFILDSNGIVIGAAMDSSFIVQHIIAETNEVRDRMRDSFYVQSNMEGIYKKTKYYLEQRKKVLFVGTPCQVAGMRLFLRNKDYPNLFLCDIFCHGVGSPMVFESFIAFLKSKGDLEAFRFRDKTIGWSGYTETAVIDRKKYSRKLWLQSYNVMFSHNIINRMSCSECKFASTDRVGDISIGDCWGALKNRTDICDELGVSEVLCNTQKGIDLFQQLENVEKVELRKDEALQNSLIRPKKFSDNRFWALNTLLEKGYKTMSKKYGENNMIGFIKNIIRKAV